MMNERIEELALQAEIDANELIDNNGLDPRQYPRYFAEKFAELIVSECLMLVYDRQLRAPTDDDGYFKVALDMVSKDIKKHFGVEE